MESQLLCCIYDKLAGEISDGIVMTFKHETIAHRTWNDIIAQPNSKIRLHLSDYDLVQIGTLNMETLEIKQERRVLINGTQHAAQLKAQEEQK